MRLIDADDLIKNIDDLADAYGDPDDDERDIADTARTILCIHQTYKIVDVINKQPTVEPVKHGHWIEGCPTETTDYFNCSVCNAGIFVNNLWRVSYEDVSEIHRYCHNCGAKMDEKEDSNHDD